MEVETSPNHILLSPLHVFMWEHQLKRNQPWTKERGGATPSLGRGCAWERSQSDLPASLTQGMAGGWALISKKFSPYRIPRTLSFYSPGRQVVFLSSYFTDGKTVVELFLVPVGELANCLSESRSRCSILQPWGHSVLVTTCISWPSTHPEHLIMYV